MKSVIFLLFLLVAILAMIGGILYLNSHNYSLSEKQGNTAQPTITTSEIQDQQITVSSTRSFVSFTAVLKNVYTKDTTTYITLAITNSGHTFTKDFIVAKKDIPGKPLLRVQDTTTLAPISQFYKDSSFPVSEYPKKLQPYLNHVIIAGVLAPSSSESPTLNNAISKSFGATLSCNEAFVSYGINKIIIPEGCPPYISLLSVYSPRL